MAQAPADKNMRSPAQAHPRLHPDRGADRNDHVHLYLAGSGLGLHRRAAHLGRDERKSDEMQESRGVMDIVARDLRSTYASTDNPYALFLASGDNTSTTTLYFSTRANRVLPDVPTIPNANPTNQSLNSPPQNGGDAVTVPQSDQSIVAYTSNPARARSTDSQPRYRIRSS